MNTRQRAISGVRLLATAAVTVLLLTSTALPASAAGDFPIAFDQPTSKTVEYGEQWFFEASGEVPYDCACSSRFVLIDDTSGKAIASIRERIYSADTTFSTSIYPFGYDLGFLKPGDYAFRLRIEHTASQKATTDAPVKLTVTPAKIATQLRAVADPNNPANITLTTLVSGRFVQELDYSQSGYSAMLPAGTWKITAKDPSGEIVFSDESTQEAGIQSSYSTYWAGPPAGTALQFEGEFTPAEGAAANFTVEPAAPVSLSTPKADEQTVVVPGAGEEPIEPVAAVSPNPSLPAWALWALIALVVLLSAVTVVLALRLRRPRAVTA